MSSIVEKSNVLSSILKNSSRARSKKKKEKKRKSSLFLESQKFRNPRYTYILTNSSGGTIDAPRSKEKLRWRVNKYFSNKGIRIRREVQFYSSPLFLYLLFISRFFAPQLVPVDASGCPICIWRHFRYTDRVYPRKISRL